MTTPGPLPERAELAKSRLRFLEFYDPMALANPMPTYPWHLAPAGMATKRQLRKKGLSPGDQPIAAQVVWRHRGPDGAKRRVAYLYRVDLAVPVKPMTPGMWESHNKMMQARRTCRSCGNVKWYCISTQLGECNECADLARGAA